MCAGAASFTIYNGTKESLKARNILNRDTLQHSACLGGLGGAMAGALISFGSARKFCLAYSEICLNFWKSFRIGQGKHGYLEPEILQVEFNVT